MRTALTLTVTGGDGVFPGRWELAGTDDVESDPAAVCQWLTAQLRSLTASPVLAPYLADTWGAEVPGHGA